MCGAERIKVGRLVNIGTLVKKKYKSAWIKFLILQNKESFIFICLQK